MHFEHKAKAFSSHVMNRDEPECAHAIDCFYATVHHTPLSTAVLLTPQYCYLPSCKSDFYTTVYKLAMRCGARHRVMKPRELQRGHWRWREHGRDRFAALSAQRCRGQHVATRVAT